MLLSLIEFREQLCNPPMTFTKGTSSITLFSKCFYVVNVEEGKQITCRKKEKWSEDVESYTEKGEREISEINETRRMGCKISIKIWVKLRVKICI